MRRGANGEPQQYTAMSHLTDEEQFHGDHGEHSHLSSLIEKMGFVRSESMDVSNDPRFFQDNVINYRITAFAGLSVVSGLMLQNAYDRAFDMKKHMGLFNRSGRFDLDYFCQLVGFLLLVFVILVNMLSTYIGVVQPYHTIRLMTAGQMGFEMSASYYLNKNICFWRHFSIKMMLLSLPAFSFSTGFRLLVRFDRDNEQSMEFTHLKPPAQSHGEGIFFAVLFIVMGGLLYLVHTKHFAVFNDRYQNLMTPPAVINNMRTLATQRASTNSWIPADV